MRGLLFDYIWVDYEWVANVDDMAVYLSCR